MSRRRPGRTAWLVTWDWAGDHEAVPKREIIAAILRPQTRADMVKRIVEQLYAAREYTPIDKPAALKRNLYPACYSTVLFEEHLSNGEIRRQNVPYAGQIYCGHNPLLFARMVDNLRLKESADPHAGLIRDERPAAEHDYTVVG